MLHEISNSQSPQSNHSDVSLELEANGMADASQLPLESGSLPQFGTAKRGYFGIGIENTKTQVNIGTLWRSANLFNAAFLFTVNRRYGKQCSDTMATDRHVPLYNYRNFSDFYEHIPYNCQLIGVELIESSEALPSFVHPERAIYLLGAEDHGLSKDALAKCHKVIQIPTAKPFSLNVAVAGSLVMYDRFTRYAAA